MSIKYIIKRGYYQEGIDGVMIPYGLSSLWETRNLRILIFQINNLAVLH